MKKKNKDAEAKTFSDNVKSAIKGKLREPFSSSPQNPPICEVKVPHVEKEMEHLHTFAAWYSAKKFIEGLTQDRKVKEINDTVIKTDDGIKIKSPHLQDILGHKYNALEEQWEIPDPYRNMIRMFRGEEYKKSDMEKGIVNNLMKPEVHTAKDKPKKERKARPPKEGQVSIADICRDLKCKPRIARGFLRSSKMEKPDGGWSWPKGHKDIDKVRTIITKGLKAK
jgi:hypothetical protein